MALSNTWRPTDAERRLADPQILAPTAVRRSAHLDDDVADQRSGLDSLVRCHNLVECKPSPNRMR